MRFVSQLYFKAVVIKNEWLQQMLFNCKNCNYRNFLPQLESFPVFLYGKTYVLADISIRVAVKNAHFQNKKQRTWNPIFLFFLHFYLEKLRNLIRPIYCLILCVYSPNITFRRKQNSLIWIGQTKSHLIQANWIKSNWIKSNWIKSNWIESNWIKHTLSNKNSESITLLPTPFVFLIRGRNTAIKTVTGWTLFIINRSKCLLPKIGNVDTISHGLIVDCWLLIVVYFMATSNYKHNQDGLSI